MEAGSSQEADRGICRDFHSSRFAEDCQGQAYEQVLAVVVGGRNPPALPAAPTLELVYQGGDAP